MGAAGDFRKGKKVDSTKDSTLAFKHRQDSLTAADRRLILGKNLLLLARRHTYGQKIFKSDVIRLARFANEGDLQLLWPQFVPGAGDSSEAGP
jgi:hypothetical protein